MSGWIKVEKALESDPRVLRMVRSLVTHERYTPALAVTLVVGALARLWSYMDTHGRDDDTLDLSLAEIDEIVGVEGFAKLLPADWLVDLGDGRVELPNFQEHNSAEAKKRALTSKRVAKHRATHKGDEKRTSVTGCNASALPDQTRPDQDLDLDQKNPSAAAPPRTARKAKSGEPIWFADLRGIYPRRAGDQGWGRAARAASARLAEGHTAAEMLAGARRYAEFVRASGKESTEFVKQAATFLGPDKPFLLPWTPPAKPETATERIQRLNGGRPTDDSRVIEHDDHDRAIAR